MKTGNYFRFRNKIVYLLTSKHREYLLVVLMFYRYESRTLIGNSIVIRVHTVLNQQSFSRRCPKNVLRLCPAVDHDIVVHRWT